MTMIMNNFSPNMLKTFDECQMKFFFKYVQKLSMPQRSALFEKGKKIHALANYYLNGADIEKMEKVLSADEKIAWDKLKSNKYFDLSVVNTEYNLSCKIGNHWVGGRLDAFMCDDGYRGKDAKMQRCAAQENHDLPAHGSFNYFILDYKTGNIPPNAEQDFQTIVYLLCADRLLRKDGYKSLKFIYLGLKKDVEKEIVLDETIKNQYEEKILSICKNIDFALNSNVYSKNKEACKTCEYGKLCQMKGI